MTGKNDRPKRYEYLKDMSIEKLEEILKASDDFLSESEEAFVDAVAEEIVRRERENRTGRIPDPSEAKRKIKDIYLSPEREGLYLFPDEDEEAEENKAVVSAPVAKPERNRKRRPFPVRGLAAAAVIILCVTTVLPSALGYESFTAMIGHWNDTVFHFVLPNHEPVNSDEPLEESFETLQIAFDANGVTTQLAPKIPSEFEAWEIFVTRYPEYGRIDYNAFYEDGDRSLSIYIIQREEPAKTRSYEKDGTFVEKYVVNDIEHYIYENNGRISITWYVDVFECSLRADITPEEAKILVDSIYERN